MTTYTWPTTATNPWTPAQVTHSRDGISSTSRSSHNGFVQSVDRPGSGFGKSLSFPSHSYAERAQLEAFLMRLNGREHRVALWDHARPTPRGTITQTGVTVQAAAAQFAQTLTLTGAGTGTTLLAGDWFGVALSTGGTQLLQCSADVTFAAGSGAVEFRHQLRAAVNAAAAVTLVRPTGLYVLRDPNVKVPYGSNNLCPEFTVDFEEVPQ